MFCIEEYNERTTKWVVVDGLGDIDTYETALDLLGEGVRRVMPMKKRARFAVGERVVVDYVVIQVDMTRSKPYTLALSDDPQQVGVVWVDEDEIREL